MAERRVTSRGRGGSTAPVGGPSGAPSDDNETRILDVAERLFARKGYRQTTIRDVARAAHVTHPLIYHYWGSKRGLLAAVLDRTQSRMRARAMRGGNPIDAIVDVVRDNLTGSRLYLRILTRAFADGMSPGDWPGGFPVLQSALDLLAGELPADDSGPAAFESRATVAVAIAMAVGWVLVEDQLLEIVGLPPEYRDEARERLLKSFEALLRPIDPST